MISPGSGPWTGPLASPVAEAAFGLQHEQALGRQDGHRLGRRRGPGRRAGGGRSGSPTSRVPSPTRSSRRAVRGGTGDNRARPRQVTAPP